MKVRLFEKLKSARQRVQDRRRIKRKGKKPINMATIHTVAVLTNRLLSKGYKLPYAPILAQRLTCSKRALNRMRIGNSKSNPLRMDRIFGLITEHFLEEQKLSKLGFEGKQNEIQRQILNELTLELGGKRAYTRFSKLEGKAEEEMKRMFDHEAPKL